MPRSEDTERPADIELGATVRMKRLRFEEKSEVEASTEGVPSHDSRTEDERENLPDEVEVGKTYKDARIRRHVSIRLTDDR